MFGVLVLGCVLVLTIVAYKSLSFAPIKRNGQFLRVPPNTLPLLGNGLLFLRARHQLFAWFTHCEKRFGFETFQLSVPSLPPGIVINDPKNIEFVLRNDSIFGKGDFVKKRSFDLFGNGIINADGYIWRIQRKAGLRFLSNSNLDILTRNVLPQYIGQCIQKLEHVPVSEVVDLDDILLEITTQIMGHMAYDMDMHTTDPFSKAFDYASGRIAGRFQNPLWFVTEYINGGRLRNALRDVRVFGDRIVESAVSSRLQTDEDTSDPSGSLIRSLLEVFDDQELVADAALNYLSAGRDTVAQGLTWTFYSLIQNPNAVDCIREELEQLLEHSRAEGLEAPDYSTQDLPYTHATFLESLRLYPPIPIEIKQCLKPSTLPDGTYLPASSIIVWCTWAMQRSHQIWGDDAETFQPERWLQSDTTALSGKKVITRTAWEFPVFNGGPRMCLGKRMAEEVGVRVIARLLERFDFVNAEPHVERVSRNSLTLPMEGGLPCYVMSRFGRNDPQ